MKKQLLLILILISGIAKSQPFIYIPDPIFRQALNIEVPGCIIGDSLNTSDPGLIGLTNLDIAGLGIWDITGITYLPALFSLNCSYNQISYLPSLPPSLQGLYMGHNQLSYFPVAQLTNITSLKIDYNPIGSIALIPPSLVDLDVTGCNISSIPPLPPILYALKCGNNNLTLLPALPSSLQYLDCSNNHITSLPTLPNVLNALAASGNGLFCIPNLPTNPSFTSDIGYSICVPQGTPNTWYPRTAITAISGLELANCFSIGTKCYVGGGSPNTANAYFWEFNSVTNAWTQKANVPVQGRLQPVAFSIGNKGYLGMGQGTNPISNNDIWEYNPTTNNWTQKAAYPGTGYMGMSSFVIGDKAYVGLGIGLNYTFPNTFYKFDPDANSWTSIANFPGVGRRDAACFSIGTNGYVCAGDGANSLLATCYTYNSSINVWNSIASTPDNLDEAAAFSINGKGYIAGGEYTFWNGPNRNYLIQYDPIINSWTSKADMPTLGRRRTTGCNIKGRGYVGTGLLNLSGGGSSQTNDWWEYTPTCYTPSTQIFTTGNTGACTGDSILLFTHPGNFYQWKRNGTTISGATSENFYAKLSGVYTCVISNACSSLTTQSITITINSQPTATITAAGATTFCAGNDVTLNSSTGAGYTYQWKKYGNVVSGATSASYTASKAGNYKVVVTNSGGCSKSSNNISVTVNPLPTASITAAGPTTFCAGGSVVLNANTGTGLTYQWKKYANNIVGAVNASYTAAVAGKYKCVVTNANGCSKGSNAIIVSVPCRVGEFAEIPFDIYPNPSSGLFKVVNGENENATLEIKDVTGKLIYGSQLFDQETEIDLTMFPAGIYIAFLKTDSSTQMKKLIIR
ncbi:MAG: T9SS type A sorting domain-containing protein [Bacteroidetes bacterium]|nr:T9SS type A sorting domain-containing protein [Bacteroidota bacterium]MBK9425409.1 T9SS type A sorting domain-containing protein [Bacteroidota bacterium]